MQTELHPDERRVDWFRILADLLHRGFMLSHVAHQIDVPRTTLMGWRDGISPRHEDGERLLVFWSQATGLSRLDLPYQRREMSVSRVKGRG